MASATLTVPESVKGELRQFSWINWSELAREEALEHEKRVALLDELDELCKNSTLTDDDCLKLGREVNKRISQRHKSEGL